MKEIKLLPPELQYKILTYCKRYIQHPTASIIRDLINETDELNNLHFNIHTLKYEKLSFYKYLVVNEYLKDFFDFDFVIFYLLTL
tara:strand:- start:2975 stop:3229 length:255 start_codon:yes stop_codon:yes gene_type:complete